MRATVPQLPLAQGQMVQLRCERLAIGGKGVCFQLSGGSKSFVVLCERALPGEELVARVNRVHRGYAEASKVQVLVPHQHAVQTPCPHFGPCGGCTLQNMHYAQQLAEKQNQVVQTLARVGKLQGVADVMQPILGCDAAADAGTGAAHAAGTAAPQPSRFRNKLVFTWSSQCWEPGAGAMAGPPPAITTTSDSQPQRDTGDASPSHQQEQQQQQPEGVLVVEGAVVQRAALGFLRPGSQDLVLSVTSCLLGPHAMSAVLRAAERAAAGAGLLPANDPSGQGCLRSLVVRRAHGAWHPPSTHDASAQRQDSKAPASAASNTADRTVAVSRVGADADLAAGRGHSHDDGALGSADGALLVVLVTTARAPRHALLSMARGIMSEVPQVAGVLHKVVAEPAGLPGPVGRAARPVPVGVTAAAARASSGMQRGIGGRAQTAAASRWQGRSVEPAGAGGSEASEAGGDGDEGGVSGEWLARGASGGGVRSEVLLGTSYLLERLGRLRLRVHADSFFQTYTAQAERLYDAVAKGAQLQPTDRLLDLYCGCGSIGLSLAGHCRQLVGYEVVDEAVADARFNAQLNGITNATFVCGDLELGVLQPTLAVASTASQAPTWPPEAAECLQHPDVVVVNPARGGLSRAVLGYLRRLHSARRLIYVSCNPATLARDLALLTQRPQGTAALALESAAAGTAAAGKGGATGAAATRRPRHGGGTGDQGLPADAAFRLVSVHPVDVFPHSDHVECVVVLERA